MPKPIFSHLKKYSYLLGILLFILILAKTDFNAIFQNIKSIKLVYLFSAALLGFPLLLIKSYCWNYIKKQQGISYSLKDSFLMYVAGLYIGSVTPGRIGEVARVFYLKKDGYSFGKSLVGIILDRLSDIAFLLLFLCLGSLFFLTLLQKQILILILGIIASILIFVLLLKIGLIKRVLNKLFRIFIPQKYQKSWKINFQDLINDLKIYKLKHYLIIFLITALSWTFFYLAMYILARGINLEVPFLYLSISVTIAGFITLIPISILGIGTRDAALILLFAPLLISKEQAIVFSALILLVSLFNALVGLTCWLIKPIRI